MDGAPVLGPQRVPGGAARRAPSVPRQWRGALLGTAPRSSTGVTSSVWVQALCWHGCPLPASYRWLKNVLIVVAPAGRSPCGQPTDGGIAREPEKLDPVRMRRTQLTQLDVCRSRRFRAASSTEHRAAGPDDRHDDGRIDSPWRQRDLGPDADLFTAPGKGDPTLPVHSKRGLAARAASRLSSGRRPGAIGRVRRWWTRARGSGHGHNHRRSHDFWGDEE